MSEVIVDNDEIIVSKELLRAISSDSRISILKALLERQKTQTELANELKLSTPTVLAHMEQLGQAGLIEYIQGNTKWKYYRLTKTGRGIVDKKRMSVILLLGTGILATVGSLALFILSRQEPQSAKVAIASSSDNAAAISPVITKPNPLSDTFLPSIPIELVISAIGILVVLWAAYLIVKKKY